MAAHIRIVAFPSKYTLFHAFAESPPPPLAPGQDAVQQAGWDVFNAYRELDRMGVLTSAHPADPARPGPPRPLWRVSDINREYEFCATYSSVLVFPESTTDAQLHSLAPFRS